MEKEEMITGESVKEGDVLLGIASSGVHSNGFSLVRKVFNMTEDSLARYYPDLGRSLGEELITPTKIYVKALKAVKDAGIRIKGCSHITGGGFYENVPRMLPEGVEAVIRRDSYELPPVFELLRKTGNLDERTMYNTYNMGIGMVLALAPEDADGAVKALEAVSEKAFLIGECKNGEKGARLC